MSCTAEARVTRREYIKYVVELVILRNQQVKAHRDLQYLKAQRETLIKKASPLDPRLYRILDRVDAEVARCEEALKFAIQPMIPRIDHLSGVSDAAPPHDILYPTSNDSPTPDPQDVVPWAEREANTIGEIINKLKAELLLHMPAPPAPLQEDESSIDSTLAKRKRLDDGSYAPSPAPAPAPPHDNQTQLPPVSVEDLPKAIADLGADVDDLVNVQLENVEQKTLASLSEQINAFRQSTIRNKGQNQPRLQMSKLELEQKGKEWSDATERELQLLDEVIKKKEKRNERMRDMNAQLLANIEKCESDLEESRVLLASLATSMAQKSSSASSSTLLKNPYFVQLTLPLQQELREAASDALYALLTSTWEDIERETLAISERTSQRLWSALGENIRATEVVLKAIGLGSD